MASLADIERELIVERTRARMEVAKQLGRKGGRKPKMTDSKIAAAKKLLAGRYHSLKHQTVRQSPGRSSQGGTPDF
jgi:DNA invertase Pin-like site-specific DNA recombinase